MIAGIRDYMHSWQLLVGLAYLLGWLVLGSVVMQRALRRIATLPKSKTSPGRCFLVNLLAGGLGLAAAAALIGLFLVAAVRTHRRTLVLPGLLLGALAMPLMSWATLLNLLRLPARTVWRITVITTGPLLAMLAITGCAAVLPAWYARQAEVKQVLCVRHLRKIERALLAYAGRHAGLQAPSLQALLTTGATDPGALRPSDLVCPAATTEGEYLYVPSADRTAGQQRIWVCDRQPNHYGHRVVLLADGTIIRCDEAAFRALLALPENAQLRELLHAGQ